MPGRLVLFAGSALFAEPFVTMLLALSACNAAHQHHHQYYYHGLSPLSHDSLAAPARFLISPFADHGPEWLVADNIALSLLFLVLHAALVAAAARMRGVPWAAAAPNLCFPAAPVLVASLLYTGVALGSVQGVAEGGTAALVGAYGGFLFLAFVPRLVWCAGGGAEDLLLAANDGTCCADDDPGRKHKKRRATPAKDTNNNMIISTTATANNGTSEVSKFAILFPFVVSGVAALVIGLPVHCSVRNGIVLGGSVAAAAGTVIAALRRPSSATSVAAAGRATISASLHTCNAIIAATHIDTTLTATTHVSRAHARRAAAVAAVRQCAYGLVVALLVCGRIAMMLLRVVVNNNNKVGKESNQINTLDYYHTDESQHTFALRLWEESKGYCEVGGALAALPDPFLETSQV